MGRLTPADQEHGAHVDAEPAQGCTACVPKLASAFGASASAVANRVLAGSLWQLAVCSHAALGAAVVANPAPLTGADFRFLRQELGLSQAALGDLVGKDEQAVARWEKGKSKKVDATADRLLRLLYKDAMLGKKKFAPMIEFLRKLESTPPQPKSFVAREVGSAWSATATAATA